jgi:hypothetical protein
VQFLLHRRPEGLAPNEAVTAGDLADDHDLLERIVLAYERATAGYLPDESSMWAAFFDQHHPGIDHALRTRDMDRVAAIFRDPASSDIFFEFDGLGLSGGSNHNPYRACQPLLILDELGSRAYWRLVRV